jgi:hypothetical protein
VKKIDRQLIDAPNTNNVFQDLGGIISDLWIVKRSKLKLQTIISDLKLSLERFQQEHDNLKICVSHPNEKRTYEKYQSCISELMRNVIRSIKKEFREKLKIDFFT